MNRNLTKLLILLVFPYLGLIGQPLDNLSTGTMSAPAGDDVDLSFDDDMGMPNGDSIEFDFPDEGGDAGSASFGSDETISVDFPDEEIRTILRNVADLYDLNLVIPDTLEGNTSIKLRNVTWREVFDVILEPIQYTYVEDRNIIKVKSQEELALEPVDTRVFLVNYADAAVLQESVGILVDQAIGGRIQVDARTNALVITERPSRMNSIQEIIERLDRPTEQVMIESKFVEVSNTDTKNLGVRWSSLDGYEVSTGPHTNSVSRSRVDTEDFTSTRTVSDDFTGVGNVPPVGPTRNSDIRSQLFNFGNAITQSSAQTTTVLDVDAFNVVISALESLDDVKLVSNPTVVTLNNTEALISIGERFPVPQYTYNDERGTFEVSGFEYQDIGINLNVTPQVNSAGFINLDIRPEVSTRQGTVGFGGASGASIPIIGSRRTETQITIKDGFTLAIGGLIENNIQKDWTKVPWIGDVPGLGRLFRSKSDSVNQRNLIIFITAQTLNPDGSTYKDIIDPRMIAEMGIVDRDLPGFDLPPEELELLQRIQAERSDFLNSNALDDLQNLLDNLNQGNYNTRTGMETYKSGFDINN